MSHIVAKEAFKSLEDILNKFPQGVPPSETLYKILSVLYTEEEAALVAKLPIRPFNISMASKIWNVSLSEAEFMLESLASKALILDTEYNGERELWAGKIAYELKQYDKAYDYLKTAYIKSDKGRCFTSKDKKYLDFLNSSK